MLNAWLGSPDSLLSLMRDVDSAIERYGSLNAMRHQVQLGSNYDEDEDMNPVSFDVTGSIVVMDISGPTITKRSFFSQIYGIVSYEDIKERLIQAHDDSAIKGVVLNIDTHGGAAEGCFAISRFVHDFNRSIMPVVSYDNSNMHSAGVLYGSAAGQMIADREATIGSIGALMVHTEITKMLEKEGIKKTVFRSAPYKALGSPYEKLSELAEEQIKIELQQLHDKFVGLLATNTGIENKTVQTWATGKVFEAEDALKMGLLDSIQPIENVIANLNKKLENTPRKSATR